MRNMLIYNTLWLLTLPLSPCNLYLLFTKLQMLVKYAVRHVKSTEYQTYAWVYLLINPALQYYCCLPRACRQTIEGDAQVRVAVKTRRKSAGVKRSFFANNSSASPA